MASLFNPSDISQSIVHEIWHYSLVNIAGNEVKINNILVALLLLFAFIHLSKRLTNFIVKLLTSKAHHDKDSINTIEKIISYVLWAISILISLQIAGIPLAIFAFIGGAFAISIGFGAQNLVSNFISTIIIMFEKPLKIGDFIETQGSLGRVKSITSRCIIIKSSDSEEVSIPSSTLMQNKLSRWTCNDHHQNIYHVLVNIFKEEAQKINHSLIIKQLELAINNLEFLANNSKPEIYITKIGKTEDQFCLVLCCSKELLKSSEDTKNKINTALLKKIKDNFSVEYSKNLG